MLAKLQQEAGAKGITCQKLGEAEVMAEGGLDDIFISYNILGEDKTGRLGALLGRVNVMVAADNPTTIAGLPHAAGIAGRDLPVLVNAIPAASAPASRRRARPSPWRGHRQQAGAAFPGLHALSRPRMRWRQTQAFLDTALAGIRANGLDAEVVSNGGTPNLANLGRIKGITEHRAGTSIFNDRMMMRVGRPSWRIAPSRSCRRW